jgi:hypothetical protein
MKAIKEYQAKIQLDMSLYMETAWSKRKAPISKQLCFFFFRSMQFPYSVTHQAEILFWYFFYGCSFHLVPKASWTITYVWLQLS